MPYIHGMASPLKKNRNKTTQRALRPRNFHLPLPADTYDELRSASEEMSQPATQLVRSILQNWLKLRKKAQTKNKIAEYTREIESNDVSIDSDFEALGVEHWIKTTS
jgi:hypothetical protein